MVFQIPAQIIDGEYRDQHEHPVVDHPANELTGGQAEFFANFLWDHHLVFRRDGQSLTLHIDPPSLYETVIDTNIVQRRMKIKFLLFFVLAAFLLPVASAFGQGWESVGPFGGDLHRLCVLRIGVVACTAGGGAFLSTDQGQSWRRLGPVGTLTDVRAVREIRGKFYAAAVNGVFVSEDDGVTWRNVADSPTAIGDVYDVVEYRGALFVATHQFQLGRSDDGGRTWKAQPRAPSAYYTSLLVHDSTLFCGTENVFTQTNDLVTWKNTNTDTCRATKDLVVHGDSVYAATHAGVWATGNNGASWNPIFGVDDVTSISFDDAATMYISTFYQNGVWKRRKGGTWESCRGDLPTSSAASIVAVGSALCCAPAYRGVYRSTDGGSTWKRSDDGISGVSMYSLAALPSTVIAGTMYNGLQTSTDHGATWNVQLPGATVFRVAASGTTVIAGTANPARILVSRNSGASYTLVREWSSSTCCIDGVFTLPTGLFYAVDRAMSRSTDNGTSWLGGGAGLPDAYIYAMDGNASTVFAGTITSYHNKYGGVYKSTDNGATFTQVDIGTTTYDDIWNIVVIGDTVVVGSSKGTFRSTDNGRTWKRVMVWNSRVLYRAGSVLYSAPSATGISYSTDAGATWTDIADGVNGPTIQALCVEGGYLYAGLEGGSVIRHRTDWIPVSVATATPENERAPLHVFPNPSYDGTVTLRCAEDVEGEILIMDELGIVVWRGVRTCGAATSFNTSPLMSGRYSAHCIGGARPAVTSFVVVR